MGKSSERVFTLSKHLQGNGGLWKGCVTLFYSQVGRDKLSLQELNKGTLVYNQTEEQEIKPVNPKGNQSWIFIGRTDAEAPILWPPDEKSQLIRKDPDVGEGWRQEEKRTTEDHRLDGHELEQAPGFGDGQGSLACSSPWGRKESDTTEWLNWTELGDLQILLYHCYTARKSRVWYWQPEPM